MKVATYEATIEEGRVKLPDNVHLPERAIVYVVVPGVEEVISRKIHSPRLARPEQSIEFLKEVVKEDAGV